jgi:hypothetical protein
MTNQKTNRCKKPRDKFKFRLDWCRALNHFPQKEKGQLFEAILEYAFYGEEKKLPIRLDAVFQILKYQIDESLEKEKVSLYVVKLYDDKETFFKIGIASDIKKRIQSFTNIGYDAIVMDSVKIVFEDREEAFIFEKRLHNELGLFQHLPQKKFGGQYECFNDCCYDSILKAIDKIKALEAEEYRQ